MRKLVAVGRGNEENDGEFLWLVSLSDLMILLFVFFVVLFSFTVQKMTPQDMERAAQVIRGEQVPTSLDEIQQKLKQWLEERNLMESVTVEQTEDALMIEIAEQILFASGQSELGQSNAELMQVLRSALSLIPQPYRIGVEGHTDDAPIKANSPFLHNWDLSARRASSVLEALDLPVELLRRTVVLGYGSTKPKANNRDESGVAIVQNQNANRRVTIRIF